jgi:hypothetical protein
MFNYVPHGLPKHLSAPPSSSLDHSTAARQLLFYLRRLQVARAACNPHHRRGCIGMGRCQRAPFEHPARRAT